MAAQYRAQSREVSTSSADMIQAGVLLETADPGKMAKWVPLAPWYSFLERFWARFMALALAAPLRPVKSEALGSWMTCMPILDRRPESMERWIPWSSQEQAREWAACWAWGRSSIPLSGALMGLGFPTCMCIPWHICTSCW